MAQVPEKHITSRAGQTIGLRTRTQADAEQVFALNRHVTDTAPDYTFTLLSEMTRTLEQERERFRQMHTHPSQLALVAEHDGRIIGDIEFRTAPRQRVAHHGQFGIGIHADYRDQGIGRAMVQMVIDWARGHPQLEEVRLGVFANNTRAIALYKKMGFVEQWRQPNAFKLGPGEYVDDVQMTIKVK